MSNSLRNAFTLCALVLCAVSAFGQTEQEIEDKYGKPIKIYSVDDTVWMSVKYTSDGQACQMTLFPKRVSNDTVYFYGQLPFYELKRVLNDIAPQSERGNRGDWWGLSLFLGGIENAIYDYEKVTISVKARARFSTNKEPEKNRLEEKGQNDAIEENEEFANPIFRKAEIVVISWKDRKCDEQNSTPTPKAADRTTIEPSEIPIRLPTPDLYEDFTKFAALDTQGLCAVHHQPLKKAIVEILYGHIIDFQEIGRKEFFPNATDCINGGCVVSSNSKDLALVLQCARCLEERETRWLQRLKRFDSKTDNSKK
jgi:hypothetical protein